MEPSGDAARQLEGPEYQQYLEDTLKRRQAHPEETGKMDPEAVRNLPGTELNVVGLPIVFDGVRPYPRSDAPKLGEHNDAILSEPRATAAE